ncbi:hypothetical protein N6G06_07585 [Cupriavidus gilardii]|uniref:hypothetical protein n=1 Tax=Cupriavidus gilardii TaxID=82541 RepID=UPI0021C16716|nr:hypothetical protein [Cupriavidus gilardii]MCT9071224.1 hypothetical protein [Cupriavidus gilardii]
MHALVVWALDLDSAHRGHEAVRRCPDEVVLRVQQEAAAKRAEEERQAREAREAEERRLAEARAAQEAELRAQREAQERELAAQRERQAAEAKRLAEERAALEHQQREAEEQRRREEAQARAEKDAADAQIRRTAPQMLDALMQWRYAEQTKDKVELENARKARDAAIEAATTVAEEVAA